MIMEMSAFNKKAPQDLELLQGVTRLQKVSLRGSKVIRIPLELGSSKHRSCLAQISFKTVISEPGEFAGTSFGSTEYVIVEEDSQQRCMYLTKRARDMIFEDLRFTDLSQGFLDVEISVSHEGSYEERLHSMTANIVR